LTEHLRLSRVLGRGGQGIVSSASAAGPTNFTLPVALKFFSPERFPDERTYREAMERMAAVSIAGRPDPSTITCSTSKTSSSAAASACSRMEWVDGYDLDSLLNPGMLGRAKARVGQKRWEYINNVIATAGESALG